jgi:putative ATPase
MIPPLAERLRPKNFDEIVGQKHIFGEKNILGSLTDARIIPSLIFYGPPGTGKTTTAQIISKKTDKRFFKLNATSASLADIKNIIAEINPITDPNGIILYIDEIQYFNKKQQQSLLELMESGEITLIASTTENPYFYIYNAVLSRSQVLEFKPVTKDDIKKALLRAVDFLENESHVRITVPRETLDKIASISCGDVRRALNTLEICCLSTREQSGEKIIDHEGALKLLEENSLPGYSKTGDNHFDLLSAFQKSMRGSDPHASVYYLARLLEAGELISVCRRLLVCACEDVGLAYPGIFTTVKSLVDIAVQVGAPEARIPLANAVIMVALSPKSNSAYKAISSAIKDIKSGHVYDIPRHLQNIHCDGIDTEDMPKEKYKYAHDYENHWVKQQYLPDELKNKKYYYPQQNKTETAFKNHWEKTTHGEL